MNLISKHRHLIVSGASFTHNNHKESHCVWSNTLAHWAGMTIDNLAIPGAGNTHVKNSVIMHLETTRPDPEKTLVLVMWTGPERIDWITDSERSCFKNQYPFVHYYTPSNEVSLGGTWWANSGKTHLDKSIINYSKYQSDSSLTLSSWLHIQDLENYLRVNNYQYYFMSDFDYSDSVDMKNRWIEFDKELKNLGLSLSRERWLTQGVDRTLGGWSRLHPDYLLEDKHHVHWRGHESWLQEILIPELVEKKVLYEHTT